MGCFSSNICDNNKNKSLKTTESGTREKLKHGEQNLSNFSWTNNIECDFIDEMKSQQNLSNHREATRPRYQQTLRHTSYSDLHMETSCSFGGEEEILDSSDFSSDFKFLGLGGFGMVRQVYKLKGSDKGITLKSNLSSLFKYLLKYSVKE